MNRYAKNKILTNCVITFYAKCTNACRAIPETVDHLTIRRYAAYTHATDGSMTDDYCNVPNIKQYPLIGSAWTLSRRKDFDVNKLHKQWEGLTKDYGHIFRIFPPLRPPMVVVTRPEDIERVYRMTMDNPARDAFHSLRKIRHEDTDDYFEKKGGILTEDDNEWWRVRSRIQTPMMKPKNLFRYISQMDEVTLDFLDRIADFQKELGEMPENFQQELYKWALENVSLVALNRRLGCLDPNLSSDSSQVQLINIVNSIFHCMNIVEVKSHWWRLFPTPTFKKLKKGHEVFLRLVDENIQLTEIELQKKLSSEEEITELSLMETLLQREGLSRKDVVTFILDMIFAGIDTTSHTMGFTLYLLSRNKDVQKKLQQEVDSVLGNEKGPITEHHLAQLSYLKCCIKESFRIFPLVLGNVRKLDQAIQLGEFRVPKGHHVVCLNYIPCRDESQFPRAMEFIPERWGRDRPLGPIHPFASIPFSHGTRMCVGRRIAEQEMFILIARVMQRFNVDYKYKDMDIVTRLVSVPSEPLKFEFIERR